MTGVTSPVFVADLTRPASASQSGISGFVFDDSDRDGQFETGEDGLAGRTVRLVDASGQPISLQKGIEPDDYAPNADIRNVIPEVTLSSLGSNTSGVAVYSRGVGTASTGNQVFGSSNSLNNDWKANFRELLINFNSPVTTVSLDSVGDNSSNNAVDYGRLAIYDANNNLLARYTTSALASGQVETMTLSRPVADIAYAIASGHLDTGVRLDNLRFGPEASGATDEFGAYSIPSLEAGSYRVQVQVLAGLQATTPTTQSVALTANSPTAIADFGFVAFVSPWQNQTNRFDVNNDGAVSPIDALLIINDLNAKGSRALTVADATPPFVDVNGDGHVAPIDVLQVINAIEASLSEGEANGLSQPFAVIAAAAPPTAEGEFVPAIAPHDELRFVHRSVRSKTATPVEAARSPRPTYPANSMSDLTKSSRDSRAVEFAMTDDLLDASALEAAIDEFADDVAATWDASRVSG